MELKQLLFYVMGLFYVLCLMAAGYALMWFVFYAK